MRQDVRFNLHGTPIAAHLYQPATVAAPCPAVIMAPGFGGVKEMLIPYYAHALAEAGIATLAFDYPNFGDSGGSPRQYVDIPAQLATYQVALDYLQQQPHIDEHRLALWGSSLSGGHTLMIAARDIRVKSAMAIIPFIATSLAMAPKFFRITALDTTMRLLGGKGKTIKIAGQPNEVAAMNSDGAWEWMQKMTADAPGFRNYVTVSSLLQMVNYRTARSARSIHIPLKVILASDDTITPARMVKKALATVPQVSIEEYPKTHFELFDQYLEATIHSTVEWFKQTLG